MKKIVNIFLMVTAVQTAVAMAPLDSLVMQTLESDPALMSAAAGAHARLAAVQTENVVESPEVEFEYLWGGQQNKWNAGISQRFDWPSLYRARSHEAASLSSLGDIEYLITYLDRALSVKLAILDLINANKRLSVIQQIQAYMQFVAIATNNAYNAGEATILDVHKLRLALAESERQLVSAQSEVEVLSATLKGMGATISDEMTAELVDFPLQEFSEPSIDPENYPQWGAARARREADRASEAVIKAASLPSFSVGYRHAFEEGAHYNGIAVSLTLPSFNRSRRLATAQYEASEAAFEYDSQLMTAIAETTGQYLSAVGLQDIMDMYREVVEDNSYLELLMTAFEGGELTILDYILEMKLYTESYLGYLDLAYRYNLALARLNRYKSPLF